MKNKISWKRLLLGLLLCSITISLVCLFEEPLSNVYVTPDPVVISDPIFSPGNQLQPYASVRLTVANNRLYMYTPMSSSVGAGTYDGFLCVFDNGGLQKVKEFPSNVLELYDGKLYYALSDDATGTNSLICYQISSQEETSVVTYSHRISKTESMRSGAKGEMYYPSDNAASSYYHIQDGKVSETGPIEDKFVFGNKTYTYIKGEVNGKYINKIVSSSMDGEIIRDYQGSIGNGSCRIIPCSNGLLIHNAISPDMLYFIDGESGDVIELFTVDGERTLSTVNIYGEYVFISFARYKDYDQMWFSRYEYDTMEGTWRISLTDFTAEKLNSYIYNGLYIFDSSGIYACDDDCNIYKLDFDGNVIMTLLTK